MKEGIHPEYFQAKVVCGGCGTTYTIGSTLPEIGVSVCSQCHPFYTGRKKLLDSEGRIDRFKRKYETFYKKAEQKQSLQPPQPPAKEPGKE
jgi:large subunit ribosomal protein L31